MPNGTSDATFGRMNAFGKTLLLATGWIALALGAIGLLVPVLPTAPFVLVAAACFARSSARLHRWLVEHPVFGEHITDFLEGRGLQARTKLIAIGTLWASVVVSIWFLIPLLAVDLVVATIAVLVTAYLLRLPTCPATG